MNFVFLDIDGVLNCATTKHRVQGFVGIDPKKVKLLRQIVDLTSAKIVLSSSWKLDFYENSLRYPKIKNYLLRKLRAEDLDIYGLTLDNGSNRGWGIIRYIQDHPCDGYIVLDDEFFIDFKQCGIVPHWVHTKYQNGLLSEHIEVAIHKMALPVVIPERWNSHANMSFEEMLEYDKGFHDNDDM